MTEDEYTVKCDNCNWQGQEENLVYFNNHLDGSGFGCPNCKTDIYLWEDKGE